MYMERLQAVIEENRKVQQRARDLNTRAGETVFPIMTQSEWKEWLAARLNGARCSMEIADFDALKLAALDTDMVAKVLANNPDTIELDGETLKIEYGKSWGGSVYCKTSVDETLARSTQAEALVLPGGRKVEIQCDGYSATTFVELVEKLEKSRIEKAWSEKRREVEKTSWISDPENVFPHLSNLLAEVEITRTSNGEGEVIVGYVSLYSDSDPDFQIRLRESKEEAEKETQLGLQRLLKKASGKVLTVPDEEPWKTSGYWSKSLTDLGNALEKRFEELNSEHAEGLTADNVAQKIEEIKIAAENAKAEIAGEHNEAKQLLETTEQDLDSKINTIEDTYFVEKEIEEARGTLRQAKEHFSSGAYEDVKATCKTVSDNAAKLADLYAARCESKNKAEAARDEIVSDLDDLRWREGDFTEATDDEKGQAYSLSQAISNAMYDRRYDDVLSMVEEATALIATVKAETENRKAARRARFPESVWEAVDNDEREAENAVELAKTAVDLVELSKALEVFDEAMHAPYGRARCQEAIGCAIWQLHKTDIGDTFLNMSRARDFDTWLRGATAWLIEQEETASENDESSPENGDEYIFEFTSNRYFRCSCGANERVTKTQMRDIKEGASLKIVCGGCGTIGVAQLENATSKKSEPEETQAKDDSGEEATVEFHFSGKRYFKCSGCGAQERVSKSEMEKVRCGCEVNITCPGCGASGPAIN